MSGRREAEAKAGEEHSGIRVDRFVADEMDLFSRSQFHRHGVAIEINGKITKPSRLLHNGDVVRVTYSDTVEPSVEPEAIDLDILYEDDDVVVLNKPQGMVVHPAAGNWTGTLVQGLMHHVSSLADRSDSLRPGIVHRLDKDTSGVLITAKTLESQEFLSAQFRGRSLEKTYLAIVRGTPPRSKGEISSGIVRDPRNRKRFTGVSRGGKPAVTGYRVLKRFAGYSLLVVHPMTGRTHQIRVHTRHIGCPILGDPVYARADRGFPDVGLMLHAYKLTIRLPGNGKEQTFTAPLPERFRQVLRAFADLPSAASDVRRQR
ncbi:MAG: RluA family pseudouridine synthase [Spirochaetia bacterium]